MFASFENHLASLLADAHCDAIEAQQAVLHRLQKSNSSERDVLAKTLLQLFKESRNLAALAPAASYLGKVSEFSSPAHDFSVHVALACPFDEGHPQRRPLPRAVGASEVWRHKDSQLIVEAREGHKKRWVRHGFYAWASFPEEVFFRQFDKCLVPEPAVSSPATSAWEEHRLVTSNPAFAWCFNSPKVEMNFSSPLVNEENLRDCGSEDWSLITKKVILGTKPVGVHCDCLSIGKKELTLLRSQTAHLPIHIREKGTFISQKGLLKDFFDFSALKADYRKAFVEIGQPRLAAGLERLLQRMSELSFEDYKSFISIETHSSYDPRLYARTGLLFGYPIVSSMALIASSAGVPQAYYHIGKEDGHEIAA